MNPTRDLNKRLKSIGMPIELSLKYERKIGLKPGEKPNYVQRILISDAMLNAMAAGVRDIQLTSEDYEIIAREVRANEQARTRGKNKEAK